ncbi:MAG TPA: hypothetical protein VI814_00910 [Candidatus Limnocylindria bacterium]
MPGMSADFGGEVRVGVAVGFTNAVDDGDGDGDSTTLGITIGCICGGVQSSGCTIVVPVVLS